MGLRIADRSVETLVNINWNLWPTLGHHLSQGRRWKWHRSLETVKLWPPNWKSMKPQSTLTNVTGNIALYREETGSAHRILTPIYFWSCQKLRKRCAGSVNRDERLWTHTYTHMQHVRGNSAEKKKRGEGKKRRRLKKKGTKRKREKKTYAHTHKEK